MRNTYSSAFFYFYFCFFKGNDQCRRLGGLGCRAPFWFTKNTVFETSQTSIQQTVLEKLLYNNLTQYSVLLTRVYGCVAEERCKPTESSPVLR